MKTIFAAALALAVGGVVGCSDTDDRRARDEQPMGAPTTDRDASTRLNSDPVCGHTVNPNTAIKETYGDQTFYFHNDECAKKFRDNPHAYLPGGDDRDLDGHRDRTREVR
jgi:YHS domain-containing protein